MSRCLRKLENDRYWIVYCNTSNVVFPYLFENAETGKTFIDCWEKLMDKACKDSSQMSKVTMFENTLNRISFLDKRNIEEAYNDALV